MPEYMSRFHKDENPECTCFDNPKLMLVVIRNLKCPLHGVGGSKPLAIYRDRDKDESV